MAKVTTTEIVLRCYAHRRDDGKWYAHCIDLSLDALADTEASARAKLSEAIELYLQWAFEKGVDYRRPSSFRFQFEYQKCKALIWADGLRRRGRSHRGGSTFTLAAA